MLTCGGVIYLYHLPLGVNDPLSSIASVSMDLIGPLKICLK